MTGTPTPDPFSERQLQAITRMVTEELTRILGTGKIAQAKKVQDDRLTKTIPRDRS